MATELAKAYVQIIPSTKGMKENLSSALEGETRDVGETAGKNLGGSLAGAIKGAVITAGVSKFISSTLQAGGAIQQSFGGLDTIYEDASEAAKNYALQAAQAGISANDYAEQAVSFGASLKMAFGGDTAKAVEAANTAILDMTDNAAKMGTPIESIQNAYQGFAKQNYTMLDNLKLGYGGTQKEMERLLSDAEKISGVKYDMSNLGDVYEAIHVIQGELGLTGVAAAEASDTFTGSMGAMKAAMDNMLAALATGQSVEEPLKILIGNARTFLENNLLPMLLNIAKGIPEMLAVVGSELGNVLMDMLNSFGDSLPGIITKIQEFIPQITAYISENLPQIFAFIGNLLNVAIQNLPALLGAILTIIGSLLAQLPSLIGSLLKSLFAFIDSLAGGFFSDMIDKIKAFLDRPLYYIGYAIGNIIGKIVKFNADITNKLIELFTVTIPNAWESFKTWLAEKPEQIKQFFIDLPDQLKEIGKNMIEGLWGGIKEKWENLKSGIKDLSSGIVNGFKGAFQIASPSKVFRDQIGKFLPEGIAVGIRNNIGSVTDAMNELQNKTLDSINGSTLSVGAVSRMNSTNQGIATRNAGNNIQDSRVFALLSEYLPQLANMQMVTDTGAMVGALAPKMDAELGRRATMRGRYV